MTDCGWDVCETVGGGHVSLSACRWNASVTVCRGDKICKGIYSFTCHCRSPVMKSANVAYPEWAKPPNLTAGAVGSDGDNMGYGPVGTVP